MKHQQVKIYLRSAGFCLVLFLAIVGLFAGCCIAYEGVQQVGAAGIPSVARMADGRLRVMDTYIDLSFLEYLQKPLRVLFFALPAILRLPLELLQALG